MRFGMGIWRSRHSGTKRGTLQPGIVPVLGAGKHRSAKSGACFMEYASFLAGERWSDHPSCTHAGLAHLARAVNDLTSNEGRSRLAPLVPSVIGIDTDDPRLDLLLAVHAAALSLPDAPLDRQHALAVGALVCRDALRRKAGTDEIAQLAIEVDAQLESAFAAAPEARAWAERFLERSTHWQRLEVNARQTQATLAMAADGVRSACRDFPDDRLAELLATSIELARRVVRAETAVRAAGEAAAEAMRPRPSASSRDTVMAGHV
jgi:hypothetical protein